MYSYFISYNWSNKKGQQGSGCRIVRIEEKITSKTNLSDLCSELAEMSSGIVDDVVILNFILLDE